MSWISPKAQPLRPSLENWLKWKMPFENLIFWMKLAVCLKFEQRNIEELTKPWMAGISIAASTSSCSLPDWKSQVKKSLNRMKEILGSTIKKGQSLLRKPCQDQVGGSNHQRYWLPVPCESTLKHFYRTHWIHLHIHNWKKKKNTPWTQSFAIWKSESPPSASGQAFAT